MNMDLSTARDATERSPALARSNVRSTVNADLDIILHNLSLRTLRKIDLYLADIPDHARLEHVRAHAEVAITERRADTFCAGDVPVGIITLTPEHDYFYTTALPTEAYFSKAFLRLSRRYNDALFRRLGAELRAYSRSDSADLATWFRLMGFKQVDSENGARIFAYEVNHGS